MATHTLYNIKMRKVILICNIHDSHWKIMNTDPIRKKKYFVLIDKDDEFL